MKSISAKVTILYIFLAIFNISVFTFIIYENQVDLITKNIKLETKESATHIYSQIEAIKQEIIKNNSKNEKNQIIQEFMNKIEPIVKKYILFQETGEILNQNWPEISLSQENFQKATRAIVNKDMGGQLYYLEIFEKDNLIQFYIPISLFSDSETIIMFPLDIIDVNGYLKYLYILISVIISGSILFHTLFGFSLNYLIIHPLKSLTKKSKEISEGDLTARVKTKRQDEFGTVGKSFNHMADSIQKTIIKLDEQNKRMKLELSMAGNVQKSIYPQAINTDIFKMAVYHKPYVEVSGDFHDIFKLDNNQYGFLIADISGHGVAAALITMLVKDTFNKNVKNHNNARDLIISVNTELSNLMNTYDKFFTAFYLILDNKKNINFTNAGHEKAILYRQVENKLYALTTEGCFMGVSENVNSSFQYKTLQLISGDKIILMSDGIREAMNANKDQYGLFQIYKILATNPRLSCQDLLEYILQDFNQFKGNENSSDDETIMIIEIN